MPIVTVSKSKSVAPKEPQWWNKARNKKETSKVANSNRRKETYR